MKRQTSTARPYQQQAFDAILPALKQHDRATAVMACGTGKTFVALWLAEAIAKRTVLVLVSSMAMLRQTLREWVKNTTWEPFDYLCVCSDPTVSQGDDELIVRPTELEFSVSTQSEDVRRFLSHSFAGVKIIVSMYQSAEVVARGMPRNLRFDIGIFDEANKTAGRDGAKFSFAFKDENLPIRKRLFLTATPRHYDLRKRDKEGDPVEVFSMNRPEIYGPVVHTLSFAQAAKNKIICNYKVVISVVTSDMLCASARANSWRAGGRQPPDDSNPAKRPTAPDRPRANTHRLANSVVGGDFQNAFAQLEAEIAQQIRQLYRSIDKRGRPCDVLYSFWVMQSTCPGCWRAVDLFPSYVIARNAYPDRKPEVQVNCPNCGDIAPGLHGDEAASCAECGHQFDPSTGTARHEGTLWKLQPRLQDPRRDCPARDSARVSALWQAGSDERRSQRISACDGGRPCRV